MTPAACMEKAHRALSGSRLTLNAGDSEGTCSRAYDAMFDPARAALTTVNVEGVAGGTKTHRGFIAAFGKHLVLRGRIDAELGRAFNRVQSLRATADYVGEPLFVADAAWAIDQAGTFIRVLQAKSIVP